MKVANFAVGCAIWLGSFSTAYAWECIQGSCPRWCEAAPYGLGQASNDLGDATTQEVVQEGMDDWTRRSCTNLRTSYTGRTSARAGAADGQSVIGWVSSGWRYDTNAIGVTGPRWDGRNCIREADMEMNEVYFQWTTEPGRGTRVNAYSIVLHEGGHYYGLGHSRARGAAMFASYTGGVSTISADDEAGICTLYPGDGTVDCNTRGCPRGQECVDSECRPIEGDGTVCSPCTSDSECGGPNDYCLAYPSGESFCGRSCASGACEEDQICATTDSGIMQCAGFDGVNFTCSRSNQPMECRQEECKANERCDRSTGRCEPIPTDRRELGEPCEENGDCNSDLCIVTAEGQLCSELCDGFSPASCTEGFYCDGDAAGTCGTGFCLAGRAGSAEMGAACVTDTDCSTLMCDGGKCTTPCRPNSDVMSCANGYVCRPGTTAVCGVCSAQDQLAQLGEQCNGNDECLSGQCAVRGDGDQFCTDFCDETNVCPAGFDCVAVGALSVCSPRGGRSEDGCGCRVVGASRRSSPSWVFIGVGFGIALWRVRRRIVG